MAASELMDGSIPAPPAGFAIDDSSAPPPPPPGFSIDASPAPDQQAPTPLTQVATGFVKGLTSIPDAAMAITDPGRALVGAGEDVLGLRSPEEKRQSTAQYWLDKGVGAVAGTNPEDIPTPTVASRVEQGVGAGLSGAVLPGGEGFTVLNMLRNGLIGAVAGGAAAGSEEAAPEPFKPVVGAAVGLGAGLLTHGALEGAGALGGAARGFTDPILAGVSSAAAERQAATKIASAATDLPTVLDQLKAGTTEGVPGSQPTLYQQTGDTGLGTLERTQAVATPAPFIDRANAQNAARIEALGNLQAGGDPMALAGTLRDGLDALDQETSADVARETMTAHDNALAAQEATRTQVGAATDRAQGLVAALPDTEPQAVGQTIRDAAEQAEQAASVRARALYQAVDPNRDLTANTQASSAAARQIIADEPSTAKPVAGEEAAIFDTVASLPSLAPASDLIAANQRVNAAMRQELMTAGRTPTYARLAQLRGAIQDNLANTISQQITVEDGLANRGALAPEDTLRSRLQAWVDEYQQSKAQAGGDGSPGAGPSAAGEPTGNASADGTGLPPSGGPGSAAGDQGLPSATPTFDDAARERLNLANATYRAKMGTFARGPIADVLRKAGMSDLYRLPVEAVAQKVWRKGATGQADAQALIKAIGQGPAIASLTDAAAASLRKAAMRDDGTLNPTAFSRWRNDYSEALKALPDDVRAKFGAAAEAASRLTQTVAERAAAERETARIGAQTVRDADALRVAKMKAAQDSAIQRIVGATHPSEVANALGSVLNRGTAVTDIRALADRVKDDPDALNGMRRAIVNHMATRFISATNGEPVKAAELQTFIRDKGPALSQVFTPEQIAGMDRIAQNLKLSQMSQSGAKLKIGSNTPQDTFPQRLLANKQLRISMLEKFAALGAGLATHNWIIGLTAEMGAVVVDAMRAAGIRNVNDLVTRAMLDPAFAHELLKQVPAEPGNKGVQSFARAARRSAVAAGLGAMATQATR